MFTPYISATLSYMKNDLQGLKKFLDVLESADTDDILFDNVKVIRKLFDGLDRTGTASYKRDY